MTILLNVISQLAIQLASYVIENEHTVIFPVKRVRDERGIRISAYQYALYVGLKRLHLVLLPV